MPPSDKTFLDFLFGPQKPGLPPRPGLLELALRGAGPLSQDAASPLLRGLGQFGGILGQEIQARRVDPKAAFSRQLQAIPFKPVQPTTTRKPVPSVAPTLEGTPLGRGTVPITTPPPSPRTLLEKIQRIPPGQGREQISGAIQALGAGGVFQPPGRAVFAAPGTVPSDPFTGKPIGPPLPAKPAIPKSLNTNDLRAFVSSNGAIRGQTIPDEMTLEQGKKTLADIQKGKVEVSAQQGAVAFTARSQQELRQKRADTGKVIKAFDRIETLIENDPAILAIPGAFARGIVSITDQLKSFVKLTIPKTDFQALNNIDLYSDIFKDTAVKSAELKSALLGAAVMLAAAEGFTNRAVTGERIRINLERMVGGIGTGSAEVALGVLEGMKQEIAQGFNAALTAQKQPLEPFRIAPRQFNFVRPTKSEISETPKVGRTITIQGVEVTITPEKKEP